MQGRHAREIAADLGRSEVTVGKHLSAIYRAAGVRDRHELVVRIAAVARPRRPRGAEPHDPVVVFCESIGATVRQREVLAGILRGLSNKEIAAELGLAEVTVEGHVTSLLGRAGVSHRIALVLVALAQ
jgi:DNA-binding NarL/FixJ family response regulator